MGHLKETHSGSVVALPGAPAGSVSAAGHSSGWQWASGKKGVVSCAVQESTISSGKPKS